MQHEDDIEEGELSDDPLADEVRNYSFCFFCANVLTTACVARLNLIKLSNDRRLHQFIVHQEPNSLKSTIQVILVAAAVMTLTVTKVSDQPRNGEKQMKANYTSDLRHQLQKRTFGAQSF